MESYSLLQTAKIIEYKCFELQTVRTCAQLARARVVVPMSSISRTVCVSPSGEWLFVADSNNHRVQVLRASDGAHVHTIGSKGDGDGQFCRPVAVRTSPNGDLLFVLDRGNNRVQVLTTGLRA